MKHSLKSVIETALSYKAIKVAIASAKIGDEGFCPKCFIRKLLKGEATALPDSALYNNGAALTPPMGWSSWNTFRQNIDEELIYNTALVMKKSGLLDAGYEYVNLDDCWQSSLRDENGRLQGDLSRFPSGIKDLCEKVNALGLKLGLYTSNGTLTCEDLPASLGKEAVDADTFAAWGIEFFKYDYCHNKPIPTAAPDIDRICISSPDKKGEEVYEAERGILSGLAKIENDERLQSGKCVTGLSSGAGTLTFNNVTAEKDGEYILTVGVRKKGGYEKFIEVTVNNKDTYPVTIPATKAWSPTGRTQVKIKLQEGVNVVALTNPIRTSKDSAAHQYANMGRELKRATKEYALKNGVPERPIVYSICEWGRNDPFEWGRKAGNLWRTTPDISANWVSVTSIYEHNVRLYDYNVPGGWNDPDMLEVGNGSLTFEENKSHFTLWCMMAAPLILGNDLRTFLTPDGEVDKDNKILKLLTNREVIAIDQDRLGVQCRRYKKGVTDILVKPLENKDFALCFFNKSEKEAVIGADLNDICNRSYVMTEGAESYIAKELWSGETLETSAEVSAAVPSHGVKVYRITARK